MKRLPTITLWLLAIAITLPGLAGLLAPATLAGHALSVDGLNEARAVGGTRLAIAIVLALAASRPAWRRPGLIAGVVVFGATLLGRVVSNAIDGMPGLMMKPEILEVVLVALASVALATSRRTAS